MEPADSTITGLRALFEKYWAQIRGSQLYAGQPRSSDTDAGVTLARQALQLATDSKDQDLVLDAWAMMAYTLNAHEEWGEAIAYYELAIRAYESRGERLSTAKLYIGYIAALTHADRFDEALKMAEAAEAVFKEAGDQV